MMNTTILQILEKDHPNLHEKIKRRFIKRLSDSGLSPVSCCNYHEQDKSVWSCMSRRRV